MRRDGDAALPSLVRTGRRRPAKREGSATSIGDRPGIRSTHYVHGTTWLADERAYCLFPLRGYSSLLIIGQDFPLFRAKNSRFSGETIAMYFETGPPRRSSAK
jgi:hypothetical protein